MDKDPAGPEFTVSAWIGVGKTIHDVPRAVIDHATLMLAIPPDYVSRLPPRTLTIHQLSELNLPNVLSRTPAGLAPASLFVQAPLSTSIDDAILGHPLLPLPILANLASLAVQAWLDGKALRHPFTRDVLPLWVIQLWVALHPICAAREQWILSLRWLNAVQERNAGSGEVLDACVARARALLQTTTWTADLSNVHEDLTITRLPRLLADGLIGTYEINGMISVLQRRCAALLGAAAEVELLSLDDAEALWRLGGAEESLRYPKALSYRRLRELGDRFVQSTTVRVLIPYHLDTVDHWAACQVHRAGPHGVSLLHGDSLGYKLPARLRTGILAWITALGLTADTSSARHELPHGIQYDGISCAIACVNTIEHAAFDVPLFRAAYRDTFRITKFVELLDYHHTGEFMSQLPLQLWGAPSVLAVELPDSPTAAVPGEFELAAPGLTSLRAVSPAPTRLSHPPPALSTSLVLDQPAPVPTKQSKLPFKALTTEEKRLKREHEAATAAARQEQRAQEQEEYLWKKAKDDEQRALEKRIATRERVRKHRREKRLAEIAQGLRPPVGRKPRTKKVVERPANAPVSSLTSAAEPPVASPSAELPVNIAELSRPYRSFKVLYKRKKRPGRPLKKAVRPAKRHNWQSPILWLGIDAAARRNGFRAGDIVKDLQIRQPGLYGGLTRQVVGTWILTPGNL
ncbi:hypothetical protein AURDEDRAFT_170548 [Auricularia subglabra TFB-10046 SS5]|nr:hypothetical protein AURDEDRAFT_170548 [Auricularia subglabra TFB-10046 SS5]